MSEGPVRSSLERVLLEETIDLPNKFLIDQSVCACIVVVYHLLIPYIQSAHANNWVLGDFRQDMLIYKSR